MLCRLIALSTMLLVPTGTAAADPLARQPTANWVVDFDAAQCVATREYGTREKPLILALKAPPLGDVVELALLRPGKGGRYAKQVEGSLGIGTGEPLQVNTIVYSAGEPAKRVVRLTLSVEQMRSVETAASIQLAAKGELDERLALTQVGPLLKVMDDCVADLRRVWNLGEGEGEGEAQSPLQERAMGDLRGLFRGEDYPDVAVRNNQQGSVKFALLIDEQGRVADCTVVETSGVAVLDSQGCAIVKERAKFKPATGPDGKPAKDAIVQRVRWLLRP